MKKSLSIATLVAAISTVAVNSYAFVDLTGVTLDTDPLAALAALTIPVLAGILIYRKVVKSTNRS